MQLRQFIHCAGIAAAVACFNAPLNASAAVESPIVGYTTIKMEANKWYMVGSPFLSIEAEAKLNKDFLVGFQEGDLLQIYNYDKGYRVCRFRANDANGAPLNKWCAAMGRIPVDITIPAGQAMFINKKTTDNVTFAGKVDVAQSVEFGSATGNMWNQVVALNHSVIKLNDLNWSGMAEGDLLQIYDPDYGYRVCRFRVKDRNGAPLNKWCASMGTIPTNATLAVGQAMFINKRSAGSGFVSVK